MKTTRHWLHILLCFPTCGLWLPVYLILLATREEYNRGHRVGKAAGRVERQNEIDGAEFERAVHGQQGLDPVKFYGSADAPRTFSGFASTADPDHVADVMRRTTSRVDRFAELADRNRTVGLDMHERAEYTQLRQELSQ
jgi:hypothetical protein